MLLHGLSGSSRWWGRNLQGFARRFRVLAPDVIGFGRSRSPRPLPPVPEIAAALAEWMQRVGAAPAHLVGHSMGGQIAIHLAARWPERVRCLVLVDAAGIPHPLRPREVFRFARHAAVPSRWGDPRFLPTMAGDALGAGPRTTLRALGYIRRDDVRPLLPQIDAPTLVVWGEWDAILPPEDGAVLRDGIRGARLVVLPGAAHNPMIDRPHDFNRVVLHFLDGNARS